MLLQRPRSASSALAARRRRETESSGSSPDLPRELVSASSLSGLGPETEPFRGRGCLVTGGGGFIGSNLTRSLLDSGATVTVIDDFSTGRREYLPRSDRLEVVEGDLADLPGLSGRVQEADFVFHLAAQVGNVKSLERPDLDARANILASVRLFHACRDSGVRKLVYSSSSAIFGEAARLPIDEDHPRAPASFYALSKLTAERYALLAHELWGVPTVCLRYFNVYGLPMEDNEYTGVISIFLRRLAEEQPLVIYGDGLQVRDFVFVEDVVRAILAAASRASEGTVFNIGTGTQTTVVGLAETLMDVTGRRSELSFAPPRSGEVRRSVADVRRAREGLGYEPEWDLRSGLARVWSRVREGEELL